MKNKILLLYNKSYFNINKINMENIIKKNLFINEELQKLDSSLKEWYISLWYDLLIEQHMLINDNSNIGIFWVTNSWKTILLQWILHQYSLFGNRDIFIVNSKNDINVDIFKNNENIKIVNDWDFWKSLLDMIYSLYQEIEYRKELFRKHNIWNIQEYNNIVNSNNQLKNITIILDEFDTSRKRLSDFFIGGTIKSFDEILIKILKEWNEDYWINIIIVSNSDLFNDNWLIISKLWNSVYWKCHYIENIIDDEIKTNIKKLKDYLFIKPANDENLLQIPYKI